MTIQTKTFLSLLITVLPVFFWVAGIFCALVDSDGGVFAFIALAYVTRGVACCFWIVHLLRSSYVAGSKLLWAAGLLFEALGSFCLGAFGFVGIAYWYKHMYEDYQQEKLHLYMQSTPD